MPSIDVAPIYSDPWVKDHYEGMAKLIERVVDVPAKTLNAITCQLWCIRFFYTEVNMRRWVDVAEIDTWADSENRYLCLSDSVSSTSPIFSRTAVRLEATHPMGTSEDYWLDTPSLKVDDVVLGIGFTYSIATVCDPGSTISLIFSGHTSTTPPVGAATLLNANVSDQVNTYTLYYLAFETPYKILAGVGYSAFLRLFAKELDEQNGFLYAKGPFFRIERTI